MEQQCRRPTDTSRFRIFASWWTVERVKERHGRAGKAARVGDVQCLVVGGEIESWMMIAVSGERDIPKMSKDPYMYPPGAGSQINIQNASRPMSGRWAVISEVQ